MSLPFRRHLSSIGLLIALAAAPGCYLSHPPAGDGARDSGLDGGPDAGEGGSDDAGADAGDAGEDAGFPDLPDAQVPCHVEPHIDPFERPAPELIWEGAGQPFPAYTQVCSTPLVIDMNPVGDGQVRPEIVFVSYADLGFRQAEEGVLRAIDGATGESLFTVPDPSDPEAAFVLEATATPAAGDLDGDGNPEIVAVGATSGTYAYHNDGSLMWESVHPSFVEREWRKLRTMISGAVTIADLEGDGFPEVMIGRVVLSGQTGQRLWTGDDADCSPGPATIFCRGMNEGLGPISCASDLDDDGETEVIVGPVVYNADGSIRWQGQGVDGFCAVGDIIRSPGAEGPEVVLVSGGYLRLFDKDDGAELRIYSIPGVVFGQPAGGPPTIANFDDDDVAEIGVAQGASFTVFDLNCDADPLPAGCAARGIRWTVATEDDSSSATGSSVFDFNGDGRAEVVYNDEEFFRVFDGANGWELFREGNSSRTRTENPVVADVDNDGNAEIVFAANNEATFLDPVYNAGLEVWGDPFDRWVGARRIWNEHAYHITNVEEDGRIPADEQPAWAGGLNAYRQNLAEEPEEVLAAADLRVRTWFECSEGGDATLVILVRNRGGTPVVPGVIVGIYDGNPRGDGIRIGEVVTTLRLEPDDGEEMRFTWEGTPALPDTADIWVVVDELEGNAEGAVRECYEGNNRSHLEDVGCPSAE